MENLDDTKAIKITEDIWWIGFADFEAGFSNNPYLLIDNDEAVLFDPGPGHPIFRDIILQKIQQVIDPKKIKYIVVHHADPDLCGLIPFIEDNKLMPVGIGCAFGEVIIGDLGEETRLDYTLIGATVNYASRMCDTAKEREIAITSIVYDRLDILLKTKINASPSFEKIKVKIKPGDPEIEAIKFS